MQVETQTQQIPFLTQTPNSFSQTARNELNKGYYPTFNKDVQTVIKVLSPSFGWKRGNEVDAITILDPCAGHGEFLGAITRYIKHSHDPDNQKPYHFDSYAVELDADRFGKIKGVTQKVNASFFDVETTGVYNVILLNPPYNKLTGELLRWVKQSSRMLAYSGLMGLIIPEYELADQEMLDFLKNRSEER